jgi:hypothetical protein
MSTITRAADMTLAERRFMGIAPWIVVGHCSKCDQPAKVRVYGLTAELSQVQKLYCEECQQPQHE